MLISKFDIYKSEWLELVFADRNKAYGAYELRQHNGRTMLTAMAYTFLSVATAAVVISFTVKPVAARIDHTVKIIPVVINNYVHPAVITPPKPATMHVRPAAVHPPVPTHAYIPFVVTPKPVVAEPPKVTALSGNIGPVDIKVPGGGDIATGPAGPGGAGTGTAPGSDETIYTEGIQAMPEPYGGAAAWSKFLQKHLVYPDMAIDNHIAGRVWLSFIIEKDGHISNISIIRGVGYGLDEEAMRVLKLSPAWKPGLQNGQPVRVKFNLPINFQMPEE